MKKNTLVLLVVLLVIETMATFSLAGKLDTSRQEVEVLKMYLNASEKKLDSMYDNVYRMKNGESYKLTIVHDDEVIEYEDDATLVNKIKTKIKEKTEKKDK